MAFILWPDVNENLKLVWSWRQQSAGFTLCSVLNWWRHWRQQTTSWTVAQAHVVALSLSSRGQIHLSQLCSSCHCLAVCLLHSEEEAISQVCVDERWACSLICHKNHMTERSPGTDPCWAPWPHKHMCSLTKFNLCKFAYSDEAMSPETSRSYSYKKISGRTKEPKQ